MLTLESLVSGQSVVGIEPTLLVTIVFVVPVCTDAVPAYYKTAHVGGVKEQMHTRTDKAKSNIATIERPRLFDCKGADFHLAVKVNQIDLAFLFDPLTVVHTSNVQPLLHQIAAVYGAMLPLRVELADDPDASKTIMAGLCIRELLVRAEAPLVLVVVSASLVEQWRDELNEKFDLEFREFARELGARYRPAIPPRIAITWSSDSTRPPATKLRKLCHTSFSSRRRTTSRRTGPQFTCAPRWRHSALPEHHALPPPAAPPGVAGAPVRRVRGPESTTLVAEHDVMQRMAPVAKKATKKVIAATMSVELIHSAYDARIKCRYLLLTMQVEEFLQLVKPSYEQQGSIEGQRDVVRTATATRIRKRMADDIQQGTILPPIVLGAVAEHKYIMQEVWTTEQARAIISKLGPAKISVIDGMQRTTVLLENKKQLGGGTIRVELWISPSTENLVYRMLILNTGQIPWNLRRQLEVVHRNLIDEIAEKLKGDLSIYKTDSRQRRTSAGEFQANDVVEMYLAFKLRKPHVDKESVLADQFSKLDLIEAVSRPKGLDEFIDAMRVMSGLDKQFARAKESDSADAKYKSGRNIFDKVSSCSGYMSAYAQFVSGRTGMDRNPESRAEQRKVLKTNVDAMMKRLSTRTPAQVRDFLSLDTLREVSEKRAGALSIGEQERELFLAAFKLMFEEGRSLDSLEPCWRSQ